jgi:hypothetical protein
MIRNTQEYGELRGGRRIANGRGLGWEKGSASCGPWQGPGDWQDRTAPVSPAGDSESDAGGPMTRTRKPGGTKSRVRPSKELRRLAVYLNVRVNFFLKI